MTEGSWRHPKSIYRQGADDGFIVGAYLTAMFALTVAGMTWPVAALPALVLMLAVPPLTYWRLRRSYVASGGTMSFSAVWMQGIMTFLCGGLIFGATSYLFLRWIHPSFVREVLEQGVEFYRSVKDPAATEIARELEMIVESKAVPTPFTMAMGWMWLTMFGGSVLSFLAAALVKAVKVGRRHF